MNIENIPKMTAQEFYNQYGHKEPLSPLNGLLARVDESAVRAFGIPRKILELFIGDPRDGIIIFRDVLIIMGVLNPIKGQILLPGNKIRLTNGAVLPRFF